MKLKIGEIYQYDDEIFEIISIVSIKSNEKHMYSSGSQNIITGKLLLMNNFGQVTVKFTDCSVRYDHTKPASNKYSIQKQFNDWLLNEKNS